MKKILIHVDAEKELWNATDYYENKVTGLGLDFEKEIQKALISVQENPKRYQETENSTRRSLLQRFPYFVYYIELEEYIWVVAFAHTSRKPFYWEKRV